MYEIIERNKYGVVVRNTTGNRLCHICKYKNITFYENPCKNKCNRDGYYLTDTEAEKLETEADTQKELLDLQIENKKLKERIKELESKCKSEYQRGIEDGKIITEHGTTMYQD